jgi:hypothetical protein
MIDQRLRARNAYLVDMDRRIEEAKKIRDADWFVPARSAASASFDDVFSSGIPEENELQSTLNILAITIEQRLKDLPQSPVPSDVTGKIVTALTDFHSREAGEANYLLGWSLADTLGKNGDPESIVSRVATLSSQNDVRLFGFYDGLSSYLGDSARPLIDAFLLLAESVASKRSELIPGRFDPMLAATEEAWSKVTDVVEVWRGRQWDHFHMYSEELSVVHALSGPQPTAFLAVCQRLQVPPLTESILGWPSIAMDFDNILRLLAAAPTVENQETRSWNRSVVAPVLLEVAFRHLMDLGSPPAQPVAEVEEVSSLARRLAETCLARSDGLFLMINWSQHLIRLASTNSNKHFDGVFSTIIDTMAAQGVDTPAIERLADSDVTEDEEEAADSDWRAAKANSRRALSFDYFMIAALVNGSDASHQKADLRPTFQRHLCEKNPALVDYVRDRLPNWRHYTVAKLYLQESAVVSAWDEDWALLAAQRREATHWSYSNDRDAAHPSLFLANVGVGLLDWLMAETGELRNQAAPMWKELFQSVSPFATHWSLDDDKWRSILQALFARYPNAFQHAERRADSDELWPYLDALGGDDTLLTIAVAHLLLNGVTLDSLTRRGEADSGLVQRIQAFLDWDASSGGRSVGPQILAVWENEVKTLKSESARQS